MRSLVCLDLSTDSDFRRRQDYILAREDTQFADLGEWRRIFAELYGLRSVDLACIEAGRTVGVASLYLIPSPFFGRILVTCPFFGCGGLYAEDGAARQMLLEGIYERAVELNADFIELRLREPLEAPYRVHQNFLEFELPLGGSAEEVWERSLSSNARQNVRKARKQPLVFSTSRDAHRAYDLISTAQRDLGTPFHPRRLFELLVRHLGEETLRFSQVHLDGELIAAGVMVRFRDRLSTPYIGSLKRFGATRANYCQYWGIIEHCIANGVRCFDLGRSPQNSPHQQFKQKWGALPVEVHYSYRVLSKRRSYRTVLEPSRLERLASETWKRLPLAVTRRLGRLVARHIP